MPAAAVTIVPVTTVFISYWKTMSFTVVVVVVVVVVVAAVVVREG